jgi:hypothetical protein
LEVCCLPCEEQYGKPQKPQPLPDEVLRALKFKKKRLTKQQFAGQRFRYHLGIIVAETLVPVLEGKCCA